MTTALALWSLLLVHALPAAGQAPLAASFRVFLKDGTPLVSYGEYTRTADRVVFTVPLGSASAPGGFQVVSLPLEAVDWEKTSRYTDAVRYKRYAESRGDLDYKALTAEVARALVEISLSSDPARKLAIARQARAMLIEWPRTHYGYRSSEVRDLALTMEEAISEVQAQLGQSSFSFDLFAVFGPPSEQLLSEPSFEETIASARAAARVSDSPAERMSLQQAILSVLGERPQSQPSGWASSVRAAVVQDLKREQRVTRTYASLAAESMRSASRRAARGDVAGVARILDDVRSRDARLGYRRADEIAALTTELESRLEAARARRLELDRWEFRNREYSAYRDAMGETLDRFAAMTKDLYAIRAMSGPGESRFPRLRSRIADTRSRLARLVPPDDLRHTHDLFVAVVSLMDEAARQRQTAIVSADRQLAGNASAAAAGALLLLENARAAITAFFARPGRP